MTRTESKTTADNVIASIRKLSKAERAKLEQWLVDQAFRRVDETKGVALTIGPPTDPPHARIRTGGEQRPISTVRELATILVMQIESRRYSDAVDDEFHTAVQRKFATLRKQGKVGAKNPELREMIRQRFIDRNQSDYQIAEDLNSAGIPNNRGGKWTAEAVKNYRRNNTIRDRDRPKR